MRHRFHSLCPYFAMFPESFAEYWIQRLSSHGDVVLDPFCGRGTTPFQALMMGRKALACDVNDVAVCLTRAKSAAPKLETVLSRIRKLENSFDGREWWQAAKALPEFFQHAFAIRTLQQLVYLRSAVNWGGGRTDAMVAALVLGSLHGEMDKSQSYFSNQMPRTVSTKPAYSVRFWRELGLEAPKRDVFSILRARAKYRYETPPPPGEATVLHCDMRDLGRQPYLPEIRLVVTSPPYFDVTNFEEDQWLRLWFLGGPPYPTVGRVSRDDRHTLQESYWSFITDMWRTLGVLLARGKADVVVRIGSSRIDPDRLGPALTAASRVLGARVRLVSCQTSELKRRQTDSFRPGARGCRVEVDCHYQVKP